MAHVSTQAPYAFVVTIPSILVGTIPIGHGWPNIVGIIVGAIFLAAFGFLICKPIISDTGKFDLLTEMIMAIRGSDSSLHELQIDTMKKAAGEIVEQKEDVGDDDEEPKKLDDDEEEELEKVVVA